MLETLFFLKFELKYSSLDFLSKKIDVDLVKISLINICNPLESVQKSR